MFPRFTIVLAAAFAAYPLLAQDPPKPKTVDTPPSATSAAADPALDEAEKSFQASQFSEAAGKYRAILEKNPASIEAQAGLVRSVLREQKLDEASELVSKFESASPNAAALHTVAGEVRFRRAEMPEAEKEFRKALALDGNQVRAYLGLAEELDSFGLHRKAYDLLEKAHEIAPDDPRVMRRWLGSLPRAERIALLERYLAAPEAEDADELRNLQHYLEFLKALGSKPSHACRLVRPVASTETPLRAMLSGPSHISGWGLKVGLNGHAGNFLVDTGASGLLVGRKEAEKAGVVRISENEVGGIGDKGRVSGYAGYVDSLQIGELEFHDCVVHVVDRMNLEDEDGLIGADVFRAYLVSLNFRERKLKLEPLPKRPDEETSAAPSLDTQGNDDSPQKDKTDTSEPTGENADKKPASAVVAPRNLPKDRYIAPEMKTWAPVFRFGHEVLVPTKVNELPRVLFLLDTGAFANTFSKRLAEQLGKVSSDDRMRVKGLNGNVEKVYRAPDATLEFGGLRQKNVNTVTLDLTNISRHTGTEVGGILGFDMLQLLDLQIDYRDNLVNFNYDPTKLGLPNWDKKK
jgi:predicted aspartyl protease/Flp pilus assembly protein TadD